MIQEQILHKFSSGHHGINHGWGNGYVLLPINHVYYGVEGYRIPINVHGGITYWDEVTIETVDRYKDLTEKDIGYWMIGFDTSHYIDDINKWPKEAVQAEAEFLRRQLI